MSGQTPTRVLIVDDNAKVRQALAMILSGEPDITVVGTAASGEEAVLQAQSLLPDIILMDLSMPKIDGINAMQLLSKMSVPPKVIVVTQHDQEEYVRRSIESGAMGYILKQSLVEDLPAAIRAVQQNGIYFTPTSARQIYALHEKNSRNIP